MFWIIFLVVFVVLGGLIALIVYRIGRAIKKQAAKDIKKGETFRFFAPVPRPGSFSFIANEGRIVGVFENVVGWGLEVVGNRRLFIPGNNEPSFLEKRLGVRWIGFFPTIKIFKEWEWSELREKEAEENGKKVVRYEIETRKENITDFFFQFSHPVRPEAIEIQDNIQVTITMLITVLNLDPERAQFLNKDPAILLASMIQSTVRSFICDMKFEDVKRMAGTAGGQNQGLWEAIKKLNGLEMVDGKPDYKTEDPLGVFGKLGKYIVRGEIVQVDAVGAAASAIEAKRLAELRGDAEIAAAEKTAKAKRAEAEGDRDAMNTRTEAQKKRIEETIVRPTGGPGAHVADVLAAEQYAGPTSKIQTLVLPPGSKERFPRVIISPSS